MQKWEGRLGHAARKAGGKSASSAQKPWNVVRTQIKSKDPKHERFVGLLAHSCPVGYDSSQIFGCLAVPTAFKRNSRYSAALRDNEPTYRKFCLVCLLRFASILETHQTGSFFFVKKSHFS